MVSRLARRHVIPCCGSIQIAGTRSSSIIKSAVKHSLCRRMGGGGTPLVVSAQTGNATGITGWLAVATSPAEGKLRLAVEPADAVIRLHRALLSAPLASPWRPASEQRATRSQICSVVWRGGITTGLSYLTSSSDLDMTIEFIEQAAVADRRASKHHLGSVMAIDGGATNGGIAAQWREVATVGRIYRSGFVSRVAARTAGTCLSAGNGMTALRVIMPKIPSRQIADVAADVEG